MEKAKYQINVNQYLIDLETNPISSSSIGGLGAVVGIVIGIIVVAFLGADLVQYVFNWLIGNNPQFVTGALFGRLNPFTVNWEAIGSKKVTVINALIILFLWFQSCFALGATFFRSHKYSWIFTLLVLIFLSMVQTWLFPISYENQFDMIHGDAITLLYISDAVYGIWAIVNYWLSYKIFCRTQNIGKFVNI